MKKKGNLLFLVFTLMLCFTLSSCEIISTGNKNDDVNDTNKNPSDSNQNDNNKDETNKFTIVFNVNSDAVSSINLTFNDGDILQENDIITKIFNNITPTKNGYEIDGWYTDEQFNNKLEFPYTVTGNINVYLKWNIKQDEPGDNPINPNKTYSVTFHIDNNTNTIEVNENSIISDIPTPTKDNYTFDNWYTDANYTTVFDFNSKITSNTDIYGKFVINKYTVKFLDSNNNEITTSQTVDYNNVANKPNNPVMNGYTFDNWYADANYTTVFNFNSKITSNTNVYAKFTINKYTVNFLDSNNNEVATSQTVDYNNTITKPSDPVKENYSFDGWYTDLEFTDKFDFNDKITSNLNVYAKFTYNNTSTNDIVIDSCGGYNEGAFVEFYKINNTSISDYNITYSLANSTTEYSVNSNLIRENDTKIRADILGITAGSYNITISLKNSSISKSSTVTVVSADRSGYAHFNNSTGVGAYNNDGTLKSNAVVVYVTDETKNTVKATLNGKEYTGLVNILQNQSKSSYPLVIRIIGRIGAATWNPITYSGSSLNSSSIIGANGSALTKTTMTEDTIISSGFNSLNTSTATKLNGLSNKVSYKSSDDEFDSYFNMLDVSSAKNVTVEGVGTDAEIFQWGFTWSKCNSIEVKNLTFTDYPEDACSFQGGSNSDVNTYGNYWVHNNIFNKGKNYWDVTFEQDKPAGDGATDFKYCYGITSCYNKFNNCKKTGLVGGSNGNYTKNVTFHHNYYNEVGSRLPLGRQANMHIYNNYYYNCGTAQDIRANAFVLSEANYFEGCTNPQKVTVDDTYQNTVIKSFGDYLTDCGDSQATVVTNRTASLTGNCKPDGSSNYTNFDTNSTLFYYDSVNKKSNVSLLTDAATAKTDCINLAGVLKGSFVGSGSNNDSSNDDNNNNENNDNNTGDNNNTGGTTTPVTNSTVLTFNNFSTGNISSATTVSNVTINPKATKTCKIEGVDETIANTSISNVLYLGGGGSYTELCVNFTITKAANITVYYKSSGTSLRYVNLISEGGTTTTSTTGYGSTYGGYTYTNVEAGKYSVCSSSSAIYLYCIVIEYVE